MVTKEVKIALITIIAMSFLYVGLNYLKGINLFKSTNQYCILMPDVSGLHISSPVFVDGFKVGIVSAINFDFRDSSKERISVQICLDKKMSIKKGSYVELKSGLTSGSYLDLYLNKYVSAYCKVGDTIEGRYEYGLMEKMNQALLPQIETILLRLDSALMDVRLLINHPVWQHSLYSIEKTTTYLQQSAEKLHYLMVGDIPLLVSRLNHITSDFSYIGENLKQTELKGFLSTTEKTLQNINYLVEQLNNPNGAVGLLVNNRLLYDRLESTLLNASDLLIDIKDKPKKYIHFSVF